MSKLFDMNNPFWSFVGKLIDVIVLHVIWFVLCIPVVTFGPATTALYYALMKDAADEGSHYVKQFFKSFKLNFKQGVALGFLFLIPTAALLFTVWFCTVNAGLNEWFPVVRTAAIIMIVVVFITFEYAFPLLARFDNTVRNTLKNAFMMSIRHLGWTIVMTVVFAGFYVLIYFFERYIFPLLILGFGLIVFIDAFILNHIFKPYIEAIEGKDKDPDEWEVPEEEAPDGTEAAEQEPEAQQEPAAETAPAEEHDSAAEAAPAVEHDPAAETVPAEKESAEETK